MDKDRVMTTKELAKYLKLNEKTVIKMAQRGSIPAVKIGNLWRFNIDVIDNYFQEGLVKESNPGLESFAQNEATFMSLSRLTDIKCINIDKGIKDKDDVLDKLSQMAYQENVAYSKEMLITELKKRESMLSTAIGKGIAIPHPRNPSEKIFKENKVFILVLPKGIEYNAPDNRPVRFFFMICAFGESRHLKILALLGKLFRNQDIVDRLNRVKKSQDIMKILLEFDRSHMLPSEVSK